MQTTTFSSQATPILRRNAVVREISFKTVDDVRRWTRLQVLRSSYAALANVDDVASWRSTCLSAVAIKPTWFTIDFDALSLSADDAIEGIADVFALMQLTERFSIPRRALIVFLEDIRQQYRHSNPYHNFNHALDIFQMVMYLLINGGAINSITPQCMLALMIAALLHDIDHPSLPAAASISGNLELYHSERADANLTKHSAILLNVPDPNLVRAQIIECILSTDIALDGVWRASFSERDRRQGVLKHDTMMLLQLIIRAADVSNVIRPYDIACRWSQVLQDELTDDRALMFSPVATLAFCERVVLPLFVTLNNQWAQTGICLIAIHENIARWKGARLCHDKIAQ